LYDRDHKNLNSNFGFKKEGTGTPVHKGKDWDQAERTPDNIISGWVGGLPNSLMGYCTLGGSLVELGIGSREGEILFVSFIITLLLKY